MTQIVQYIDPIVQVVEVLEPQTSVVQVIDPVVQVVQVAPVQINLTTTSIPITGETPTGLINGINATFTSLLSFQPDSLMVYINGIRQKLAEDYVSTGTNTIILSVSPGIKDRILIDYQED
jgi:hypothetical protein